MSVLCFYSKYSNQSKNFVDQTKSLNLQYICVDNSITRKKIKNNKQLQIEYVPCVLILYENGVVEKYEGKHAFRWATNQLQLQSPPQEESQPRQEESQPRQEEPQPRQEESHPRQEEPQPRQDLSQKKTDISTLKEEKSQEKLSVKDLAQQLQSERNTPLIPKK